MINPVVCPVPRSTTGLPPRRAATHRSSEHRMINPVVRPVPQSTTGLSPRRAATHRYSEHRMTNPVVCPVPPSTTGLPPRRAATHRSSEHRMINPVVRPVLQINHRVVTTVCRHTPPQRTPDDYSGGLSSAAINPPRCHHGVPPRTAKANTG